jgi:hypothetical protein
MPTCANRWIRMALYIGRPETPHIHYLADFLSSIKELNHKHKYKTVIIINHNVEYKKRLNHIEYNYYYNYCYNNYLAVTDTTIKCGIWTHM